MLWFFAFLLLNAVNAQKLDISSRSSVLAEESLRDSQTSGKIKISRNSMVYAELSGFGEVSFTIFSTSKKETKEAKCKVFSHLICILWNLEAAQYDEREEFEVTAHANVYLSQEQKPIEIKLIGSDVVELTTKYRTSIYFGGASSVNLLVSLKEMPTDLLAESSKIQFFVFRGFSGQLHTTEFLFMYMKKGDFKVTEQDSDRASTSTIGFGSVITLLNSDPSFCFQPNCQYSIRLEAFNIPYLEFETAIFPIHTVVPIEEGQTLIDQLRDNDLAIYEITSAKGDSSWNWRFNLIPIEGNPDVSINGDTKPTSLEEYKWKSSLEGNEDIFISGDEITKLGLSGKKFYVYMSSVQQSTFLMTVFKKPPFSHEHIVPNEPISGEAQPGEIINYFYRADLKVPEKIRMFIKVRTLSGDPDIYMKSCTSYETMECRVTQNDIDNAEKLAANPSVFFRYSNQNNGDDTLFLEFNCIPDNPSFENFKFKGDESNLFTSRKCLFAIAVVGKSSATSVASKYTLVLRGGRYHEILKFNEGQNFRIEQMKFELFYIDIDSSMFKEKDAVQSINFKFVIISGDADIYFSRTIPYPSPRFGYDKVTMVDNNNTQLHSTVKYTSFTGTPEDLQGRYYFNIHAREFLFGSVICTTNYQDFEVSRPDGNIELIFGQAIVNSIAASNKSNLTYYFNLDVPENKKEVEIVLQLTPIEGKFKYCVMNGAPINLTWNDCIWIDDDQDGSIIISQNDTKFLNKGTYSVLIFPVFTSDSEGTEFTFSLTLSSQDSYVPLTEGLTYRMLVLRNPKIFRLSLSSNSKPTSDLVILLTTLDSQAELKVGMNKESLVSTDQTNVKTAIGTTATILYSVSDIEKDCAAEWNSTQVCHLYIRVKPSNKMPYEYSLLAYGDDKPVFLTEDAEQSLPMPIKAEIELIHSPLNNNKSLSVNVYCDAANLEVTVNVEKAESKDNPVRHTYVVNDRGTNIVHIPSGILLNLENPVITIKIINLDYKKDPAHFEDQFYETKERVIIQLSSGVKRLNHLVPILETQGRKGAFIFYKFIKPIDTNAMIYLSVLEGEADLYVKKGDSQFPDLNTFDYKSTTLKNDELMIPASGTDPDDQADTRSRFETYIVGVYCKMSTQYQIVASKNSSFLYYQAELGDVIVKEVSPTGSLVISYINKNKGRFVVGAYGNKGPVKVYYKANDENSTKDFFDILPGETDSMFQSVSKYSTRQTIQPLLGSQDQKQYLFRIAPKEGSDYVTIFVYEEGGDLYLKGGETFNDFLKAKQCQSFIVYYDVEVIDETVTARVDSGEVNLTISNSKEGAMTALNQDIIAPKEKFVRVREVFNQRSGVSGPVNVFKEYSIKVCAKQSANYRLTTSKPSLIMQRLIPGSRMTIKLHPDHYHKIYYYRVHPQTTKNLQVRVDLEKIGASSTKITDISKVFELVEFFYVPDFDGKDHGVPTGGSGSQEDNFNDSKKTAELDDKKIVNDGGATIGILNFKIENGFFMIRAKEFSGRGDTVGIQFVINNVYPISVFGKTLAHLPPGKEAQYEVLAPPESELTLTLSACAGNSKIDFFKVTQDEKKELYKTKTLKSTLSPMDYLNPSRTYTNYLTEKIQSEQTYFTITNLDSGSDAVVTINSDLTTFGDSMTVADYFAHYNGGKGTNSLIQSTRYGENYKDVYLTLAPLVPSAGFEKKYKDFHQVIVNFTVFASRQAPNWNLASQCIIRPQDSISFGYNYSTKADFNVKDGIIDWKDSLIELPVEYDPMDPFTYVLIQVKMTFLGDSSDSADDDALVVIANSFQITKPSSLPDIRHPAVPVVLLIIVACILLCVYRIYKYIKNDTGRREVRRVFEQGAGNQSRQIETMEDLPTPKPEIELKAKEASQLDDTL